MKKVIITIVLMLFLVPAAVASPGKVIQLDNLNSTVIDVGAIQQMDLESNCIIIKFGYSTCSDILHYRTGEAARNDYQRIFKEMKNHRINECLRYGGGKACYSI